MKTCAFLLICIACATCSYGQKIEFSGQLNTGFSRFTGESAIINTMMLVYLSDSDYNFSFSNGYGKKFASSFGASVQGQRVTGSNFLYGGRGGVELLRSRADIYGVIVYEDITSSSGKYEDVTGKTGLHNYFVNLHPYLGYRLGTGAVNVDFTTGLEVGLGLSSREKGEATASDGMRFAINKERGAPERDIRACIGITAYYNHFGLSAGYAHGLTNYLVHLDGADPILRATVARLGLLYRL